MTAVFGIRNGRRIPTVSGLSLLVFALVSPTWGLAQDESSNRNKDSVHRATKSAKDDQSLVEQIQELRGQVAELKAALEGKHRSRSSGTSSKPSMSTKRMNGKRKMSGSGKMGAQGMGASSKDKGMMGGKGMKMMGGKGMKMVDGKGMKMMDGKGMKMMGGKGMKMMGRMGRDASMETPSALPGFPGASHIYHIGSTGFFLDHPEHIQLTKEQQKKLNQLKEKSLLNQATLNRQIEEAEQQLWTLTASDKPDIVKIKTQVRKVETLQGDRRIAFIRAVGEAAKVLTGEQRSTLVGQESRVPGTQPKGEGGGGKE